MNVLALDLSISSTGVCIVNENLDLIFYTTIKTKSNLSEPNRLFNIYNSVEELIKKYKPEVIVFEDVFVGPNKKTAILLSRLSGLVIGLTFKMDLSYKIITTMQMKKFILGDLKKSKNRNLKEEMRLKIIEIFNLPVNTNNDITDSIGLGLTYFKNN